MKTFLFFALTVFMLNTALAAEMQCEGRTNEGKRYAVTFDFSEMSVSIDGDQYQITTSYRSDSYMRGTQFIETAQKADAALSGVRATLVWSSYYATGSFSDNSVSFYKMKTNESESVWLTCTPGSYNGPKLFKK